MQKKTKHPPRRVAPVASKRRPAKTVAKARREPRPRREVIEAEVVEVAPVTAMAVQTWQPPVVAPPIIPNAQRIIMERWFANRTADTVRNYKERLQAFAKWARGTGRLKVPGTDYSVAVALLQLSEPEASVLVGDWVADQLKPDADGHVCMLSTVATRLATLRSFSRVLKMSGGCSYALDVRPPKSQGRSVVQTMEKYDGVYDAWVAIINGLSDLANVRDPVAADVRDWALVKLGSDLGLRRIEMQRLDVEHVNFQRNTLQVHRKGRKYPEPMNMDETTAAMLRKWIAARREAGVPDGGPLFVGLAASMTKGGEIARRRDFGTRWSRSAMNKMLERRAVTFHATIAPHDLRRILCTEAIELYGLKRGKEITGHAQEATLSLYDLSAGREMKEMTRTIAQSLAKKTAKVREDKKRGRR